MWLFSKELAIPIQLQACACLINHPQCWQRLGRLSRETKSWANKVFVLECSHKVGVGWHREACAELLPGAACWSWGNRELRTQSNRDWFPLQEREQQSAPCLFFGTIFTVLKSTLPFFFPQGKVTKSIVSARYRIYFHNRQICSQQRRSVFSEGNKITYLSVPKAPHARARVPEAAGSVLVSAADCHRLLHSSHPIENKLLHSPLQHRAAPLPLPALPVLLPLD